ncbi:MAG: LamG-like jellyroll fold domain-containing protein [bacterium]
MDLIGLCATSATEFSINYPLSYANQDIGLKTLNPSEITKWAVRNFIDIRDFLKGGGEIIAYENYRGPGNIPIRFNLRPTIGGHDYGTKAKANDYIYRWKVQIEYLETFGNTPDIKTIDLGKFRLVPKDGIYDPAPGYVWDHVQSLEEANKYFPVRNGNFAMIHLQYPILFDKVGKYKISLVEYLSANNPEIRAETEINIKSDFQYFPIGYKDILTTTSGNLKFFNLEDISWSLVNTNFTENIIHGFDDISSYSIKDGRYLLNGEGWCQKSKVKFNIQLYKNKNGFYISSPSDLDSDNDGWPNIIDNAPNHPNIDQSDTDEDGVGDVCDTDDDNDTMPDEWEQLYSEYNGGPGLDPLVDDAGLDLDDDGYTNLEEYNAGTIPNDANSKPDTIDLNDGLVAYYPFNGNANDESGSGKNGILEGSPTFISGAEGNAIQISQDNYVRIPNTFVPGNGSFTISLWYSTPGQYEDFNYCGHLPLFTIQGGDFTEGVVLSLERDYAPNLRLQVTPEYNNSQSIFTSAPYNAWHNVTAVVDRLNSIVALYIDGEISVTEPLNISGSLNPTMDMLIGAYDYITTRNGCERVISGNIALDELRVYNKALSTSEIQGLANMGLNQGLVAYYPFNGNANDESGNGHDGAINGAILTTDRNANANSAFQFDGIDDYIIIDDSPELNITRTLTIIAMVQLNDASQPYARIVSRENAFEGNRQYNLTLDQTGELVRSILDPVGSINTELIGSNINDGNWHQLAITYDSNNSFCLFVDGVLEKELNATSPLGSQNSNVVIGGFAGNPTELSFSGKIDEVRIYNRVLSASEIQKLAGPILNNGLIAYYPFNGNANDESGNGHDGIVNGAELSSDRFGNEEASYFFSGNDYIVISDSDTLNFNNTTISAWIKLTEDVGNTQWRIVNRQEINNAAAWGLEIFGLGYSNSTGNTPTCHFGDSNIWHNTLATSHIDVGKWYHLVATNDGLNQKIYIDGTISASEPSLGDVLYNINSPIVIGRTAQLNTFYFQGYIDEVRIYNRALSASEVQKLFDQAGQGSISNGLGMIFNLIPADTFIMGSPEDEFGRNVIGVETQHLVSLTQSFYMQTTEVTQKQWEAVMGSLPSNLYSNSYDFGIGDNYPVYFLSWDEVQNFINKLNKMGMGTYRLPTEAEWEYACRSGSATAFANGDMKTGTNNCSDNTNLDSIGWYCYNSDSKIHPVSQKESNAWGLYDMHGNVWEWCSDWYIKNCIYSQGI